MKTAGKIRFLLLLAGMLLFVTGINITQAQSGNLLQNAGFESGFVTVDGDQPRSVATGWLPWNAPRTEGMASFQNTQPKYIAASAANAQGINPRKRTGNDAQIYYSFFETHDGGIYQQVTVTPNTELRFSVYAHVWSSTFEDANVSDDPGDVALRVGIDPTGGTDGLASSVIYSENAIFYDTFRQYSVIARATGSKVTVFVRTTVGEPVQNTYIYLDDAELAPTSGGSTGPSNATPTSSGPVIIVATDTPRPPTATSVPPTSVPPTSTPTTPPVVIVASDTPVDTEPTPTREGTQVAVIPTATPITLATATPVSGGATATSVPNIGGTRPVSEEFPGTIIHQVRSGDTVGVLATLYGSSIDAVIAANKLDSRAFIRAGQNLVIPVPLPNPATDTPAPVPVATVAPSTGTGGPLPGGTTAYIVQPGDTLSSIARRFSTTLGALSQLNGITNANLIFAGQRLIVPGTGTGGPVAVPTSPAVVITATPAIIIVVPPPIIVTATPAGGVVVVPGQPRTYVVQPGDNLYRISIRFNVSMAALANTNRIVNFNLVFAGQTLVIPQ